MCNTSPFNALSSRPGQEQARQLLPGETEELRGQKTEGPWGKLALGKEVILVNTEAVLTGVTLVTRHSAFANDSSSPDDLASYEVFLVIIATVFN